MNRVPLFQKIAYGCGSFTNNLLSGAFSSMAIVLNLGLGMDPAVVGTLMALSRITDAFLDPVMGYISDSTVSKWGRRRPYLFAGAILSGLIFAIMWQIPTGHSQQFYFWFFLLGTNLFYVAFTMYGSPFIALGYEMTSDYYERLRVQGFANIIGQIPWLTLSWSYAFMENKRFFDNSVDGARTLALIMGGIVMVVGVFPALFCKEPFYAAAKVQTTTLRLGHHISTFFKGFLITLKNRYFLKLVAATFLVFNGFTLISGLGSYVIIFYVCGGDQAQGAKYVGLFGTTLSVCTFIAISIVTWLGTKIGKKSAFMVSTSIAIFGYLIKWFSYHPGSPNLLFFPAPFIAFGLGGLFVTVSSMIADVCDLDELQNGYRREGTFGAIYWWMVKLGMAMALALSGHLLNQTGFVQSLGANQTEHTLLMLRVFEVGLPALFYGLAIVAMFTYDLSPAKVEKIQRELEQRRGKAG